MSFCFFPLLKVYTESIEKGEYCFLNIDGSHYIAVLLKSQKSLELVSSLQNWAKTKFEISAIGCINIWPNLILRLPRV